MKSNTQRAIYEPCNILHSNPCLKAVNYCYRELHVTCGRSSGSVSDKVLNQQLETFSRKGTTSLTFQQEFERVVIGHEDILYRIGIYMNLLTL